MNLCVNVHVNDVTRLGSHLVLGRGWNSMHHHNYCMHSWHEGGGGGGGMQALLRMRTLFAYVIQLGAELTLRTTPTRFGQPTGLVLGVSLSHFTWVGASTESCLEN